MTKELDYEYEYTPSHIANFFLKKNSHNIDNLKLNKIVYISLGFSLAILDKDLFQEKVEAWKYGPVIPSLYHEFKCYTDQVLDRLSCFYSYMQGSLRIPQIEEDRDLQELLEAVYTKYGKLKTSELIVVTHKKGTPWADAYKKNSFGIVINKEKIKEYYKKLISNI